MHGLKIVTGVNKNVNEYIQVYRPIHMRTYAWVYVSTWKCVLFPVLEVLMRLHLCLQIHMFSASPYKILLKRPIALEATQEDPTACWDLTGSP